MTTSNLYGYRDGDWAKEIYPMPAFPMLLAADMERSHRWYVDDMGFADVFTLRSPAGVPLLIHLRWCRWADLLVRPSTTPATDGQSSRITLNFATDDPDAVAERARRVGATIAEGPVDRPWNARDVTLVDPDGHRLNFTGQSAAQRASTASFDEVMRRARDGRG